MRPVKPTLGTPYCMRSNPPIGRHPGDRTRALVAAEFTRDPDHGARVELFPAGASLSARSSCQRVIAELGYPLFTYGNTG